MADHHQLVDQIRAFVQSSDQTRNNALESLASAYAEACVDVNQRMSRCHRLLQQGLRSEAIQLADSEPKLLESLAALDFPERADWDELGQIYELAAAPKLAVDQAQFLNEAYAQEDPLQDLLRMHRRLALQRAPIRSRIGVMRKLAAQDSTNPIWNEDLRTFEKARFRQVQTEATEAAQSRNVGTISQLLAEIEQQSWVEPPPKALLQALRKADALFRGQQMRSLLNDLDTRLNDAFAARDPIRGRLARQEWIALTASAPLAPADPIWERVQPALSWLEEADRQDELHRAHEDSMAALVQRLDDSAYVSPAELERLAHAVLQYGQGMPEAIQQRYVSRLSVAETTQQRRLRLIITGSAACLLMAGSLAFYTIRSWARASDATQAAGAINDMIALDEIDRAAGFLEKIRNADAGLLSYPPMIEATQKFEVIRDKETDRAVQFDKALRAAEQAPLEQTNPPELEAARKLARQQTEKQAIAQVAQRRAALLAAARAKHEQDLAPRLDAIGRKIAVFQQTVREAAPGKANESSILASLSEARRDLAELLPRLDYVGGELQSLATAFSQKIDKTHAMLEQRRKQGQLEEELTGALAYSARGSSGNLVNFANELDTYIKLSPDEPHVPALRQTRDEQNLWSSIEEWARLVEGWKDEPAGAAPHDPKARAEQCSRFLTQHPATPDAAEIAIYQRHLEAIDRRGPGADSAIAKIKRLLTDILVENLWMLKVRESESRFVCYYLDSEPGDTSVLIRHLVGFDAKKRSTPIVKASIVYSAWSPQTKIANRFRPILAEESTRSDWEKVTISLAIAIRDEPEIDPVLQVALLRSVLEQAATGSEALEAELKTARGALDLGGVNVDVPWMDPEDADARKMRPKAAHAVQALPPLSSVLTRAMARRAQIERQVRHLPRAIGWLSSEERNWRVRAKFTPPGTADLWVVVPGDDKRGQWRKVGIVADAKIQILGGNNNAFLAEGRPVFVRNSPLQ
jgi:hypothetical protein